MSTQSPKIKTSYLPIYPHRNVCNLDIWYIKSKFKCIHIIISLLLCHFVASFLASPRIIIINVNILAFVVDVYSYLTFSLKPLFIVSTFYLFSLGFISSLASLPCSHHKVIINITLFFFNYFLFYFLCCFHLYAIKIGYASTPFTTIATSLSLILENSLFSLSLTLSFILLL